MTDDAAKRVPLLIEGGDSVIRDVGQIVSGARNSAPLRWFVDAPAVTTLGIDTDDSGLSARR